MIDAINDVAIVIIGNGGDDGDNGDDDDIDVGAKHRSGLANARGRCGASPLRFTMAAMATVVAVVATKTAVKPFGS